MAQSSAVNMEDAEGSLPAMTLPEKTAANPTPVVRVIYDEMVGVG